MAKITDTKSAEVEIFSDLFEECFPNIYFFNYTKDGVIDKLPNSFYELIEYDTETKKYILKIKEMSEKPLYKIFFPPKALIKQNHLDALSAIIKSNDEKTDKDVIKFFINRCNDNFKLSNTSIPKYFLNDIFYADKIRGSWQYDGKRIFKWNIKDDLVYHKTESLYKIFLCYARKNYAFLDIGSGFVKYLKEEPVKAENFINFYKNNKPDPLKINGGLFFYYYPKDDSCEKLVNLLKQKFHINDKNITIENLYYDFYFYHKYRNIYNTDLNIENIINEGSKIIEFISTYNFGYILWPPPQSTKISEKLIAINKILNDTKEKNNYYSVYFNNENICTIKVKKDGFYKMIQYDLEAERKGNTVYKYPDLKETIKKITAIRGSWSKPLLRILEIDNVPDSDKKLYSGKDMQNFKNYAKELIRMFDKMIKKGNSLVKDDRDEIIKSFGSADNKKFGDLILKIIEKYKEDFVTPGRKSEIDKLRIKYKRILIMNRPPVIIKRRRSGGDDDDEADEDNIGADDEYINSNGNIIEVYNKLKSLFYSLQSSLENNKNSKSSFRGIIGELKEILTDIQFEFINSKLIHGISEKVKVLLIRLEDDDNDSFLRRLHKFNKRFAFLLNYFLENNEYIKEKDDFIKVFIDERIYGIVEKVFYKGIYGTFASNYFFYENNHRREPYELYRFIIKFCSKIKYPKYFNDFIELVKEIEDEEIKLCLQEDINQMIEKLIKEINIQYGGAVYEEKNIHK